MGIKKHGVTVGCEHCHCVHSDDTGSFDVTVPIETGESRGAAIAKLHCVVTPVRHEVELVEWDSAQDNQAAASAESQQQLSAVLEYIAERRICGNHKICPPEVIEVVRKQDAEQ